MNNHIIIIYHYIYDIIQYMIIICLEMVLPAKCSRRIWHQHQDVLGLVLGAREVPGQLSNQSSTRWVRSWKVLGQLSVKACKYCRGQGRHHTIRREPGDWHDQNGRTGEWTNGRTDKQTCKQTNGRLLRAWEYICNNKLQDEGCIKGQHCFGGQCYNETTVCLCNDVCNSSTMMMKINPFLKLILW